ncbi:hypothetical protein [Streptomyces coryli]|uniref:hypothetical protein n=1 Tax=Streptomyces coryli TaxID=1128680 RepID=UPI0019D0C2F2|nr:hypothetical protein [Streptomyces coryli]
MALAPAAITTDRFSPEGFAFAGTEEVRTAKGPMKVIVLRMKAATLTDYRLSTRDSGGAQQELTADRIEMRGHVTLYMRRFAGCIQGTPLCLSFSPETLPAPPVVPPFVYMTKVRAEQALITTDSIKVDNLGITTRGAPAVELDYGGTKPADEQRAEGKQDDREDEGEAKGEGKDKDKGEDRNGPGLPGRREERPPEKQPGDLKLTDLERAPSDVPWCEKVTLTVRNTGGRTISGADVTFTSHIVGAIGVDWVTETSRRELPDLKADDDVTKTWRVCVDEKHAPRFLLGRHLEHEAAVDYPGPGSAGEPVPVPYP